MKVLGIGNALVDILVQLGDDEIISTLGFPKGSMQLIRPEDISEITRLIGTLPSLMVSGGSAANTIHGLACLGTPTGYFGKVGHDDLGNFYAKDLKDAGVSAILLRSHTVTGRAFTLISPDTERTFATYLGAAIEMTAEDIMSDIFSGYAMLHIEGYLVQNTVLIEQALKMAKSLDMMVSLDLASFNVVEASLEFLRRVIPEYVDILFANEDEAKAFTGKDPEKALIDLGRMTSVAVVKVGKKGSLIYDSGSIIPIGIIQVTALDTTGAGDQYAAGFLHGLSQQLPLKICGQLGALMAGYVIENYGARIPGNNWPNLLKEVEAIKKNS